jgi:hypothetical protein
MSDATIGAKELDGAVQFLIEEFDIENSDPEPVTKAWLEEREIDGDVFLSWLKDRAEASVVQAALAGAPPAAAVFAASMATLQVVVTVIEHIKAGTVSELTEAADRIQPVSRESILSQVLGNDGSLAAVLGDLSVGDDTELL